MRPFFALLALAAVSTSCTTGTAPVIGADGGVDLCAGQTCSGHGTCAVINRSTTTCVCDTGFTAQGTECVAVTAGAECDGLDCNGAGTCIVARGEPDYPVCQCRAGFRQVGNTMCVAETNPCEGITCGGNGTCAVRGTEGVCVCNAGFALMGNTMCVPVAGSPCEGITCSSQGQCAVADGMARCLCNPGFVANGTACEPAPQSPCSGITCAGHGTCAVTTTNQARCVCDSGYTNNGATSCVMTPANPCSGVTCSGQGVCGVTSSGQAVCACNPGYRSMGTTCVAPVTDGGLPACAGITCSGQGQCAMLNSGLPTCICNAGFYPKGSECLSAQDFACRGITCGGQGSCRLIPPTATTPPRGTCDCNRDFRPGTLPNGDPTCVDPCVGVTCSGNGTCRVITGANQGPMGAVCFCNPGFKPGPNNTCVPGCGAGCPSGQYCQFSNDLCRPLPATGAQWGIPQTQSVLTDIAVTAAGEYYVGGEQILSPGFGGANSYLEKQAVLVKYSAQHTVLWERVWGMTNRMDVVRGLALDSAGNVWTVGVADYIADSTTMMATGKGEIVRWGPDGTRQWTFKYDLPTRSGSGEPDVITVGPAPAFNVVVGGDVFRSTFMGQGNASSLRDVFVMQISTAGAGSIAWTKVFGPNGDQNQDTLGAVAIDANGDVYAAGSATGNVNGATNFSGGGTCDVGCTSGTCTDVFVTKWNAAGTLLWSTMSGVTARYDRANDMVVTGDGVFVVSSTQRSAPSGGMVARFGGAIARFNPMTGAQVWRQEIDATPRAGITTHTVELLGVAVDSGGSVHTAGYVAGNYDGLVGKGFNDVVSTRWAADGTKLGSRLWGSDDPLGSETATKIGVSGTPAKVHIVGNGPSTSTTGSSIGINNFTQPGSNASFVLVE